MIKYKYYDFSKVPGPTPWYYNPGIFYISPKNNKYYIQHDESDDLSGITKIVNSKNKPILILDFQCYIQRVYNNLFLIWHELRSNNKVFGNNRIDFYLLDFDNLSEFTDYLKSAHDFRKNNISIGLNNQKHIVSKYSISIMPEGIHSLDIPDEFKKIDEVFVLADYYIDDNTKSNFSNSMIRAIYSFNFSSNILNVYPQDWFNNGSFDFGYQWITQIARLPNGKLCGNGIRIGEFILDKTYKSIK